jgi:hypothetical protein
MWHYNQNILIQYSSAFLPIDRFFTHRGDRPVRERKKINPEIFVPRLGLEYWRELSVIFAPKCLLSGVLEVFFG